MLLAFRIRLGFVVASCGVYCAILAKSASVGDNRCEFFELIELVSGILTHDKKFTFPESGVLANNSVSTRVLRTRHKKRRLVGI